MRVPRQPNGVRLGALGGAGAARPADVPAACARDQAPQKAIHPQAHVHIRILLQAPIVNKAGRSVLDGEGWHESAAARRRRFARTGIRGRGWVPRWRKPRISGGLGLTRLVEHRELGAALRPRSEFLPTEPDETSSIMLFRGGGGQLG